MDATGPSRYPREPAIAGYPILAPSARRRLRRIVAGRMVRRAGFHTVWKRGPVVSFRLPKAEVRMPMKSV